MNEEPVVVKPIGGGPVVLGNEPVRIKYADGPVCGGRGHVLEMDGVPLRGVRRLVVVSEVGRLCSVRIEFVGVALDLDLKADLDGQVVDIGSKRFKLVEED